MHPFELVVNREAAGAFGPFGEDRQRLKNIPQGSLGINQKTAIVLPGSTVMGPTSARSIQRHGTSA
ncbi:MAG: hypothetical protein CM15mP77_1460 [Synechococcus sp.]|nr:MAG: hypothetical protein CM15mP77_1460 [Synechococcus sp.]